MYVLCLFDSDFFRDEPMIVGIFSNETSCLRYPCHEMLSLVNIVFNNRCTDVIYAVIVEVGRQNWFEVYCSNYHRYFSRDVT